MLHPARWRLPLGILVVLSLAGCAALTPGATERSISVGAEGHAVVVPDIVTITVGVQTTGPSVGPTVAENNRTTERVIAAVQGVGVSPDDIQTTSFNVSSQIRYDEFGQPTDEVTYWVDNLVTLTLRDISQLGLLLDEVLAAGANSIQSLSYGVGDPSAAQAEAREEALAAAQVQAQQLAASAGVTLGQLLSVTESSGSPYYGVRPAAEPGTVSAGVPTAPGTLEVTVNVSVTYGIR